MKIVVCKTCGIEFKAKSRRGKYSIHCSRSCYGVTLSKDHLRSNNPQWKGGRNIKLHRGEIQGWQVTIGPDKRALEHRVVVERYWGRKLGPGEYVLHVNGNKLDSRLVNLYVTKGCTEGKKIIHGSLPWPSCGNVLSGVPRQRTDVWGKTPGQLLNDRSGGVDVTLVGRRDETEAEV